MIEGARQLPIQHLTIRLPWHDNGWQGTFCKNPCGNSSCTILPRIATGRDDTFEMEHAGESIEGLEREQLPPCIDEHGTMMARFPLSMLKNHPYAKSAVDTHGHFAPTPYTIQPYSVAAIPFRWMLKDQAEGNEKYDIPSRVDALQLGYDAEREPDLKFGTTWIQEGTNQRVLLDTFFSAAKVDHSLVFFYAKRTPMIEDARRVLLGVGRVKNISAPTAYRYVGETKPKDKMSGYLWERNIEHSIRPDGKDGFLLPYQELLALSEEDESIDLAACTAFAPDEYFANYSYGTELLPHDGAIASLLALENSIKAMRGSIEAPWDEYLQWIDRELNRLWQVRGAFPGLGAALNAFGLPHGNLLAWHLVGDSETPVDPWPLLTGALNDTSKLPAYLRDGIGKTMQQKWTKLPLDRRALLILLSRFDLTNEQALRWYQESERKEAGIEMQDENILVNPYRIFEADRLQIDPIAFAVIDRGMFPPDILRKEFPVPKPSLVPESIDERRVRSVMVQTLEEAASNEGHTFLPVDWLIRRIRNRAMKPDCLMDADVLPIIDGCLLPMVATVAMGEQGSAYQLDRYFATSKLIAETISKRKTGVVNTGEFEWLKLVNRAIDGDQQNDNLSVDDKKARKEKAAALEIIFRSRVSVLMGSAGTGKSTLLKALCNIDSVNGGGILLLAPTGKARVRLEQTSGMSGRGKTVAQFLNGYGRYDGNTGRYFINENAPRSSLHKTVIIDESSMLTEEQLAALLDALKGVERLIFVGDPKQLPPIGAGRPYVDIVKYLTPKNADGLFPKVAPGYAELTVTMRQIGDGGHVREDVLFANAFGGRSMDAGADEIWHTVATGKTPFVKLVRWDQSDQLQRLILDELVLELGLKSKDDQVGFNESIGGVSSEYNGKTNVFFNAKYSGKAGSAEKAEDWQILSPIRQTQVGVTALNRLIQKQFKKSFVDMASVIGYGRVIPSPVGTEGVIYGDKVINLQNSGRRYHYPKKDGAYVANGDVGIVTGHRKTKFRPKFPTDTEVEFSSQLGFSYSFAPWEFDGERGSPPLELAYALTIHKTQGSEFGKTFLVVPNPCRLLSREMLYTALTRHKGKVVILHQGDFKDLQRYSHEQSSEVSKRMTTMFRPSVPVEVKVKNQSVYLDSNLIYRTERGELVRSKSEWIIADKMQRAGIDYQYEQELMLDGIERLPDFTIIDDDSGRTWYWEHNGMLSNDEYRQRWERKLKAYRKQGILPLSEGGGPKGTLLITEEKVGSGLDASEIEKNIAAIMGA